MTQINYNRPNGGYAKETWKNPTAGWDTTSYWKDMPKSFPEHRNHKIILTKTKPGSVHKGAYRCVDCNKHLAWASKSLINNKR